MSDNEVRRCNRILAATAEAANILLTEEKIDRAVNRALQMIGEALNTDRVSAIENWYNPAKPDLPHWKVIYEWHSAGTISQILHPELAQGSYEGVEEWYALHESGQGISCELEDMPEPFRSGQAKLGVKVLHAVPIFVGGKHWGVIGFDDCHRQIERSEAELSILKTIAACIGGAIERERTRQAKKEADRQIMLEREQVAIAKAQQLSEHNRVLSKRDRILAATAEASSILLTGEDINLAVNRALKIIGKNIDTDRIAIVENFNYPTDSQALYWKITHEWDSEGTISQISHPVLNRGSYEGIEEWYELFNRGKTISCQLEEMPEPFRSKMARLGVKTLSSVPIFIEGQYWGNVGIDDCKKEIYRSEAELNILKTAAVCIGGAIERERTRRAKEEAERKILLEREQAALEKSVQLQESNRILSLCDKWLEATAKAANKLLEIADLDEGINTALKVLGENLDCDRVEVMRFVAGHTDTSGSMQKLYQWNSPTAERQSNFDRLKHIANLSMDRYIAKVRTGEWIGGLIEEYPECDDEQMELGIKSTYAVSISVDRQFWGILAIDYCRQAKRLILPEIAVFKTAASCIGSAIYRQQIQQEKKTAELAILEERNRMAREMHDTLAQAFTGISLQLEAARSSLDTKSEIVLERLLQAKNLAKEGIIEARRSVRALRPEALEFGLVTALEQTLAKLLLGTNIKARTVFELGTKTLIPAIEVELFRIAQEAITNAIRHAQAQEIELQLIYESDIDTIYLQIKDNGIGFNPEQLQGKGFGLLGIQERCDRLNAHFDIRSEIGRGTEITITVVNSNYMQ